MQIGSVARTPKVKLVDSPEEKERTNLAPVNYLVIFGKVLIHYDGAWPIVPVQLKMCGLLLIQSESVLRILDEGLLKMIQELPERP